MVQCQCPACLFCYYLISAGLFDSFGVGHSSTSISAALGMAEAKKNNCKIATVIGDGAMTAGMAFEAMAHAGHLKTDMLIILNEVGK